MQLILSVTDALNILIILYFRGRKGAEALAISMLCQLPLPEGKASEGVLPIDLRNTTTFGVWVTEKAVLHWHQKTSRLQMYADAPHVEPREAFEFLVNLAICVRPFMHPIYFEGLQ